MQEFLSTALGKAVFITGDILLLVLVLAINYKWFVKRLCDILFSALAILFTLPVWAGVLVAYRVHGKNHNDYPSAFTSRRIIGKKGKPVEIHEFAVLDFNGEEGDFGKKIRPFAKLPRLFDVFTGALSFIGPLPMPITNEYLISDEDYERFKVRSGLINPLVLRGKNETRSYEKMFRADRLYVKKHNLFGDIAIFLVWLFLAIRSSGENRLGVAQTVSYPDYLLREGLISQETYDEATASERKILERAARRKKFRREMANRK